MNTRDFETVCGHARAKSSMDARAPLVHKQSRAALKADDIEHAHCEATHRDGLGRNEVGELGHPF